MEEPNLEKLAGPTAEERAARAAASDVPQLYANSFMMSISLGDVVLVLERNNHPECTLNLSYTTAKTLAIGLGQIVAQLEQKAGRDIMTSPEIEKYFSGLTEAKPQ